MLNPDRYQPVVPSDIGHPVPFEGVQLVLFDLDGTLVDSVGDLAWCGNEMLRLLGMPARDSRAASNWDMEWHDIRSKYLITTFCRYDVLFVS